MEIVKNYLDAFFENEYSGTILSVMLVLYGGLAAPRLPGFVRKLFENAIFRILILSLVAYGGNKNPQVAIVIAIAFIISMNYIRENDFIENFADDFDDDYMDDDNDEDEEDTELIEEEEEMNECKKHIHIIYGIYKESKDDEIIDLGEKWRDFHKKRIEVIEKRSNLMRLICDSQRSLKEKKAEKVKIQASDSKHKKEELKDIEEEIKEKEKEINDIKKEMVEYRKSEKDELHSLKKEFREDRRALRLKLAKNPKAFKKYNEVEKKIKLEAKKYKKICRETYRLNCEKPMDESSGNNMGSTHNGSGSTHNGSGNMNSNTHPSNNQGQHQNQGQYDDFENFKGKSKNSTNFENMNDIAIPEDYPIPN